MIEHRYGKRHELSASLPVALFQRENFTATGRISNVGLHGFFIETPIRFNKNTYLKIRFTLPNNKGKSVSYQTWGLVTHDKGLGIGLQLDMLNSDNLIALKAITDWAVKSQDTTIEPWKPSYSQAG